jgi:hypothetical protein
MNIDALRRPIRRLPYVPLTGQHAGELAVDIIPMTEDIAQSWHQGVQPLINAQYRPWPTSTDLTQVRADVNWDWRRIRLYAAAHNAACALPGNWHGPAIAWCLVARASQGQDQPVGMLPQGGRAGGTLPSDAGQSH